MAPSFKAGPVIREEEQLVLIVSQDFEHRPNKRWNGTLELERKVYQTHADILHAADDKAEDIRKVLRVCMASGSIEDITDDVLDAAEGKSTGKVLDFRGEVPALQSAVSPIRKGMEKVMGANIHG